MRQRRQGRQDTEDDDCTEALNLITMQPQKAHRAQVHHVSQGFPNMRHREHDAPVPTEVRDHAHFRTLKVEHTVAITAKGGRRLYTLPVLVAFAST